MPNNICHGWVCLHRKIIDSMVFQNEGLLKVWIWCLAKANHEKAFVPIKTGKGFSTVEVGPGQFIFGRKTAAKELNMDESTIYKRMQILKKHKNVTIESNNKYSIITIINWMPYQDVKNKSNRQSNKQVTSKEQASNTNNNDNNKNKPPISPTDFFSEFWKSYPRKDAKEKAKTSWSKISPDETLFETIVAKVEEFKKTEQWTRDNGQFIPYATTWLNQKRWEDEIQIGINTVSSKPKRTATNADIEQLLN